MNILIVDDEELARNKVRRFLKSRTFDIQEAKDGLEAVAMLKSSPFDIVFLDVEMPGLNGIEVLQNIEKRAFKVIFQTAYDEFAIKAFSENACDYLLKPFTRERFDQALDRALVRHQNEQQLRRLEAGLNRAFEKISVKTGSKTRLIDVVEIECFTSQDHYTFIHTPEGEFISDLSLEFLEERLNRQQFLRIHRNAIVRRLCIRALVNGQNMHVELNGGRKLPVARNRRRQLKELFS